MPDGSRYTLRESVTTRKRSSGLRRAKDDVWLQLQRNKVSAGSEQELQEIRAIEQAGHRRRRRWLNEKVLRDMAGPMSAQDMQSQFSPVPFGSYPPPSAFASAMAPEHLPLWEHFRNIDLDKQDKVLQRWEQHNQEQQQQQQQQHRPGTLITRHEQQEAAAAAALDRWRAVSRSARSALKKANVHSVLELEMQLLQLLEQPDPHAEQLLELPDGFARLLVHGLAEFHGLLSSTRVVSGSKLVCVRRKPQHRQQHQTAAAAGGGTSPPPAAAAVEAGASAAGAGSSSGGSLVDAAAVTGYVDVAAGDVGVEHGSRAAHWLLQHDAITCCDVIMALHELGSSFDQHGLGRFMKMYVHGSVSDMHSDDYVMV
uniref:R3H domain-containing protein n=1 Tax=Tetradesmus obliquus TaxID=3088 RepID=A0A383VNR7_TETOB|eukprot:jgi/Sobl393_1/16293/SZX66563.1